MMFHIEQECSTMAAPTQTRTGPALLRHLAADGHDGPVQERDLAPRGAGPAPSGAARLRDLSFGATVSRHDRTRRALLDAAAELLSKDTRASLGEVATAAGVGRTTLHRYFATRESLVLSLADEAVGYVAQAIADARLTEGPVLAALRRALAELVELGPWVRFLNADPVVYDSPELTRRWYEAFEPVADALRRGQDGGTIRSDLPVSWLVDLLGGAVITAWDSVHEGRLAAGDAAAIVSRSVLDGIAISPTTPSRRPSPRSKR
jgi:TetR/AcrR family transcriptional repressor of lfrA